jgi:hypothetical protein
MRGRFGTSHARHDYRMAGLGPYTLAGICYLCGNGSGEVTRPTARLPNVGAGRYDKKAEKEPALRVLGGVAIRATMTAAPITSAGRFSSRGPRGMDAS